MLDEENNQREKFPAGPVVDSELPAQGVWVPPLNMELVSHMPHRMNKILLFFDKIFFKYLKKRENNQRGQYFTHSSHLRSVLSDLG